MQCNSIQFNESISGRSNRSIDILSCVKSLRNQRINGGAFLTNSIDTFCGTALKVSFVHQFAFRIEAR